VGQTIACANQKGGVGKTTTVVNLATYLALAGQRVLLLDLDPQGNATGGLGIERADIRRSIYDALIDGSPAAELIHSTPVDGLSLIPSAPSLAGAEVELAPLPGRERRLMRAVSGLAPLHDIVLIDCPPSLGLLTVNALTAADSVLIPLQCEYYALDGLTQLLGTINLVRDHLNPSLEVEGILLTMYDARTNLSADVVAEVRRHLPEQVYETVIPRNVRLSEAPSHGLPIALYRPDSKGAEAYLRFAAEFGERRASRGRPREPGVIDLDAISAVAPSTGGRSGVPSPIATTATPAAPALAGPDR
jgi:chromosome partitioning protein